MSVRSIGQTIICLDDEVVRVAVALRLGLDLCHTLVITAPLLGLHCVYACGWHIHQTPGCQLRRVKGVCLSRGAEHERACGPLSQRRQMPRSDGLSHVISFVFSPELSTPKSIK